MNTSIVLCSYSNLFVVDIHEISLIVCKCRPAAFLLLELGLFPSAPVHPTLAVDLDLLDFTSAVFRVQQPNIQGWTDSLQIYLHKRGYVLDGDVRVHFIFIF